MKKLSKVACAAGAAMIWGTAVAMAAAQPAGQVPMLEIKADQVKAKVSPMLYGLMTEEINYCYDGGLYAELIVNRIFKENARRPVYWRLEQIGGGTGSMGLDANQPMNQALTVSLKLNVTQVSEKQRVGVSNEGFWGIPIRPNTKYRATLWAKGGAGFTGPLTLALVSNDTSTVYAQAEIAEITDKYRKYEATLTTGNVAATKEARFHIWAGSKGTVWFSLVSLFPPTYKDRPNGLRPDIMQLLADMKPAFLRFPGGNYLEGQTIATRFDWKKTIGDISERPGHMNDAWGYWSSDGMGLLEFLEWCEDLNMEPVMGIYSGYSLRGQSVPAGEELKPYVQDALDEIEYTIGDVSTTWGARRARDGHPAPFKLTYVEIGNEENLGRGPQSFNTRFTQFFDAIKAKYPQIKIIAATPSDTQTVQARTPDVYDDHYYPSPAQMIAMWNRYDNHDRSKPKVFVGEYATRGNGPITPDVERGLCDATFIVNMERNSDVVIMASYAPLFVNVNPGASQWQTDLIGFDVMNSFGSTTYYVLKMFAQNHGDTILTVTDQGMPTRDIPRTSGRQRGGEAAAPTTVKVPLFFYDATRDSANGTIYVKVVNPMGAPQPVRMKISGVAGIEASGQLVELKGASLIDLNTINTPTKIVPVTTKVDGLSVDFTRTFAPFSVNVLTLKGK